MEQTIIAALLAGFVAFFGGWVLRAAQIKPTYSRSEVDARVLSDKAITDNIAGRLLATESLTANHGLQLATLQERLKAMDNKIDLMLDLMTKRKK